MLFDVGHQCYTHKLLTGRQHLLGKLRQRGACQDSPLRTNRLLIYFLLAMPELQSQLLLVWQGVTPFMGEAYEPDTNPTGRRVVAFVGDAAIVNGVAMEGLNNAGTLKRQFLIVLNDNNMSIANPQGAIADYFDHLRVGPTYRSMKKAAKNVMGKLPGGSMLEDMTHRMTEMMKDAIFEDSWFEHFGYSRSDPWTVTTCLH